MTISMFAVLVVLAAAAPESVAGVARGGHRAPGRCPFSPADPLIAADAQAAVFEGTAPGGPSGVFGCSYARRGAYLLGRQPSTSPAGGEGVESEVLAGPILAYDAWIETTGEQGYPATGRYFVVARDLRSGRILRKLPTGQSHIPMVIGLGVTSSLVVKSDGAVAWIVQADTECGTPPEPCFEVHAVDRSGTRVLASGLGIDPESLALAGSAIYWTQAGKPTSAPLN